MTDSYDWGSSGVTRSTTCYRSGPLGFAAWSVTQMSVVTTQDTFLAGNRAFKGHRAYEDAFGGTPC